MDSIDFEANDTPAKSIDVFWLFLNEVGKKAEENGITEELLNKLLNEGQ
ncbi:MAG: hypothetical protein ABI113_22390 [Mucilaginibacter sp.]